MPHLKIDRKGAFLQLEQLTQIRDGNPDNRST